MDVRSVGRAGANYRPGRPDHRLSLPSLASRHTGRPDHRLSLPSLASRHTGRPDHRVG